MLSTLCANQSSFAIGTLSYYFNILLSNLASSNNTESLPCNIVKVTDDAVFNKMHQSPWRIEVRENSRLFTSTLRIYISSIISVLCLKQSVSFNMQSSFFLGRSYINEFVIVHNNFSCSSFFLIIHIYMHLHRPKQLSFCLLPFQQI